MKNASCLPVAAIILAAGGATRMGRLKQLLPYGGRTLVQRAIQQAIEAGLSPVIVVVGAEAQAVQASIAAQRVEIVQNDAWQSGMGSSIVAGIQRLRETGSDSAAVLILLADQPLVTANHIAAMRELLHTNKAPIIAAQYDGILGVPALFKREMFPVLAGLQPEGGAGHLLRHSKFEVTAYPLPDAAVDIDTPEDFAALEIRSAATAS